MPQEIGPEIFVNGVTLREFNGGMCIVNMRRSIDLASNAVHHRKGQFSYEAHAQLSRFLSLVKTQRPRMDSEGGSASQYTGT